MASLVLSEAEMRMLPPSIRMLLDLVAMSLPLPSSIATMTLDLALSTTMARDPAMETLPSPLTAPARAWAARSPLYAPSIFWVRSDSSCTSPRVVPDFSVFLAVILPETRVMASLPSTLMATAAAMELAFLAWLIAMPVPRVLKLPWLVLKIRTFAPETLPATVVVALWLVIFRPTAAATWNFCAPVGFTLGSFCAPVELA